ncbi:MAG: protein kinase [Verrucomicrobiia bacterium]
MATPSTCLNCGAPLVGGARQEFCPKCLFLEASAGLLGPALNLNVEDQESEVIGQNSAVGGPGGTSTSASRKSEITNQFGDYELLEEIGRGGMGVVYRARQRSLNRVVAIKMMAFGPNSYPDLVKRFRAEAVSAASLHHPNIVAIHEVGIHEDRHFFVMDYVEGQGLARLVGNQPLPVKRAAVYLQTIAEAVHYAHERGILHRDLKPSNVLIDAQDQPHVVDFGLARQLKGDSELTVTGQVLGSPQYLPPEQAAGQRGRVSRRTDVYALGATLYHLLTGRPPFQAESLTQTLDLVLHAEPVAPRLLNPSVPRDLETICLKCLEKEPARRYPTAQALAEELARFLAGEPIQARPLGPADKAWRWCRRKPQLASLTAVAALLFVSGFAGVLWQWRQAESQRQRAEAGELAARRYLYAAEVHSTQLALEANNLGRALELLDRQRPARGSEIPAGPAGGQDPKSVMDLRGWEWRYLWQQSQSDADLVLGSLPSAIFSLEASSDRRFLAASSELGAVKVWDLSTRQAVDLAPAGGLNGVLAFSPDAHFLLFTDQSRDRLGTIGVWDTRTRERLAPIVDPRYVASMGFSPDGRWFAFGVGLPDGSRRLLVRDFAAQRPVRELVGQTEIVDHRQGLAFVFTPDGQQIVASETDGRIVRWNFMAGSEPDYFNAHKDGVTAMAISPDGRVLATGAGSSEAVIRLWEASTFRQLGILTNHLGWISDLKFSPDGQTLASSSGDQTIRLWDPATMAEKGVLRRHKQEVWRICFSADGRKLFSGTRDGTIYGWSAQALAAKTGFEAVQTDLWALALAPDATQFAGLRQGGVCLGDIRSGQLSRPIAALGTNNTSLLFSGDGQHLFAGTEVGEIQVWSLGQEKTVQTLHGTMERVVQLRQDALGRFLVAVQSTNQLLRGPSWLQMWNTATWQPQASWTHSSLARACALSPDGRHLATAHLPGIVLLCDLAAGLRTNRLAFTGRISDLAFSPDGQFLAASTEEGSVKIWGVPALRELTVLRALSLSVHALAFSPDSRRLGIASEGDEAIRLWDVATWQPLITLGRKGTVISQFVFTAQGKGIAAVSRREGKEEIILWQAPSLVEIEAKEEEKRAQ